MTEAPFTMPILQDLQTRHAKKESLTFIPNAEDREWSERNHYQTLERCRERGGFSWGELAAIFARRRYHAMTVAEARAVCMRRAIPDPLQRTVLERIP